MREVILQHVYSWVKDITASGGDALPLASSAQHRRCQALTSMCWRVAASPAAPPPHTSSTISPSARPARMRSQPGLLT
jgi:hypothetical protein